VPWNLGCYGKKTGDTYPDLPDARHHANKHIQQCPHGAMPWATQIEWHPTDSGIFVAACGEWLNHSIEKTEEPPVSEEIISLHVKEGDEESRLAAIAQLAMSTDSVDLASMVVNLGIENIELKTVIETLTKAIKHTLDIANAPLDATTELERQMQMVDTDRNALRHLFDFAAHNLAGYEDGCTHPECEDCYADETND